jgi:hypothetical protein
MAQWHLQLSLRGSHIKQDVIEGAPDALGFGVVCLCRSFFRGVVAQLFAFRLPFLLALDPTDTRELRGGDSSLRYVIDAVHEVCVVCARRVLLRRVTSKVRPFAGCHPCVRTLVPADALEL